MTITKITVVLANLGILSAAISILPDDAEILGCFPTAPTPSSDGKLPSIWLTEDSFRKTFARLTVTRKHLHDMDKLVRSADTCEYYCYVTGQPKLSDVQEILSAD